MGTREPSGFDDRLDGVEVTVNRSKVEDRELLAGQLRPLFEREGEEACLREMRRRGLNRVTAIFALKDVTGRAYDECRAIVMGSTVFD
jgi:hypothetical protein